jgi:hypothetical protein
LFFKAQAAQPGAFNTGFNWVQHEVQLGSARGSTGPLAFNHAPITDLSGTAPGNSAKLASPIWLRRSCFADLCRAVRHKPSFLELIEGAWRTRLAKLAPQIWRHEGGSLRNVTGCNSAQGTRVYMDINYSAIPTPDTC